MVILGILPVSVPVQVIKFGTALGRSVDLTRFHGYDELISELDQMFDFNGSLINGISGFHITYKDDEGDMMLVGDNPWQLSSKTFYCCFVAYAYDLAVNRSCGCIL